MTKLAKQYAALPMRRAKGSIEVLLVTSRFTKRWVLPKGWPGKKMTPWQAAAREAFEEAGLKGKIEHKPVGSYEYEKWLAPGKTVRCKVRVYPFKVGKELDDWPEAHERQREWVSAKEASDRVDEPDLKALLRKLAA